MGFQTSYSTWVCCWWPFSPSLPPRCKGERQPHCERVLPPVSGYLWYWRVRICEGLMVTCWFRNGEWLVGRCRVSSQQNQLRMITVIWWLMNGYLITWWSIMRIDYQQSSTIWEIRMNKPPPVSPAQWLVIYHHGMGSALTAGSPTTYLWAPSKVERLTKWVEIIWFSLPLQSLPYAYVSGLNLIVSCMPETSPWLRPCFCGKAFALAVPVIPGVGDHGCLRAWSVSARL